MTDISLKRAYKIRKDLEANIAKLRVPSSSQINLFETVDRDQSYFADFLKDGENAIVEHLKKFGDRSNVLASLRARIAEANINSGVEAILAGLASADRIIAVMRQIADAPRPSSAAGLSEEVNVERRRLSEGPKVYSGLGKAQHWLDIQVVSDTLRETVKADLKRMLLEKEALEEKRNAINASHTIEITDEMEEILKDLGYL